MNERWTLKRVLSALWVLICAGGTFVGWLLYKDEVTRYAMTHVKPPIPIAPTNWSIIVQVGIVILALLLMGALYTFGKLALFDHLEE